MNIESTNDNTPTTPAITYSECYAQVFSRLFFGDCLIESDKIESGTVDLILTDLPYGTMNGQSDSGIYHQGNERHEWDEKIPTENIFKIADRILRPNGRMILFAQDPFTTRINGKSNTKHPF
jgi:DNA modification methylase